MTADATLFYGRPSATAHGDLRERAGDSSERTLDSAFQALGAGDIKEARELAQSVLLAARAAGETRQHANALACLAQCDRIGQSLRRSADTARRAAQLFERIGDTEGEARSLVVLAQVAMLLGRTDEAYEAALLVMRLSESHGMTNQLFLAQMTLGLTSSWSGSFERADQHLEAALGLAPQCDPAANAFQPRLNQAWVEVGRLVEARYQSGRIGDLARLQWLVAEYRQLDDNDSLVQGPLPQASTVGSMVAALLSIWQGRVEDAQAEIQAAMRSLSGTTTWLDALVRWGIAEVAWAQGDLGLAGKSLVESKGMALAVEHEKFACMAQQMLVQVLEDGGRTAEAQREHRELRARERRLAADGQNGRLALVDWNLSARRTERHLEQALGEARKFEKWSLEDELTGLPNRRCAEQVLRERMALPMGSRPPLTVAMLDVDKFKRINDDFSHHVGDLVLRELGSVLQAQLRGHDLPARWAGDEFVILFADQDEAAARAACERIVRAIARHDWARIAPELRVSVSIGLSQADDTDTIDSLLGRSDDRMYETKSMGLR